MFGRRSSKRFSYVLGCLVLAGAAGAGLKMYRMQPPDVTTPWGVPLSDGIGVSEGDNSTKTDLNSYVASGLTVRSSEDLVVENSDRATSNQTVASIDLASPASSGSDSVRSSGESA